MVVKCIATDRVHIEKLRYVPAGKDTADLDLYSGPVFDTLDPELSRAFFAYLEDRNINDDMADFITTYSREKEQNEYAHWLQQLANFTTDPNDVSKA